MKYGQPHPVNADLVFYQYNHGKERWVTRERFARYHAQTVARMSKRYSKIGNSIKTLKAERYRDDITFRNKLKASVKEYSSNHRSEKLLYNNSYYSSNRDALISASVKYQSDKLKTNPIFRARFNLKRRMHHAMTKAKWWKTSQVMIGCNKVDFIRHIESLFKEGMTWENYGMHGWHLDHIRPCCSFDLSNEDEAKQCFNYKNLQPLWAKENLSKGSKRL